MMGPCGMAALAWVTAAVVFGSIGVLVGYIVGVVKTSRAVESEVGKAVKDAVRRTHAGH